VQVAAAAAAGAVGATAATETRASSRCHRMELYQKILSHVVINQNNHMYSANGVSAGGGRVGGPSCNVLSVTVRCKDGRYGDKFTSQVFCTAWIQAYQ
jgi:hypothetical protein